MKPDLSSIQEFVQQVVEAIAAALGIEAMVFNSARYIIAGTGATKMEVGKRYGKRSLTGNVLINGCPLIAREPGSSEVCRECARYGICTHFLVVAYPIKVGKEILGSFCLVAVNEEQRRRTLAAEENMLQFLDRMCQLIGIAINEKKVQDELNVVLKRYDNAVNSVNEGIIVIDESGQIIDMNKSALNLLGIELNKAVGANITGLFPELPLVKEVLGQGKKVETEIAYHPSNYRKKSYFLATLMPILAEGQKSIRGATVSLRNLTEVHSYAAKLVGGYSKYGFDDIQGNSEEIQKVKRKLQKAALTDSTILIRGESGTGKELFAHAVHGSSYRRTGPFIAINCSAIPESLMESELFGYNEGAFTGAKRGGKPGKFELAAGGTLFLDEIGDMPLHLQSKLLRVLETHCVERVGGLDPVSVDVRIIAATNRNLEEMVERREFRGDLYYRLSVIPVFIPPLRERKQDILLLIEYFLTKYSQMLGRVRPVLDDLTLETLLGHYWPGNVRELQNTIEYAINMCEGDQPITLEHLPQRIFTPNKEAKSYGKEYALEGGEFETRTNPAIRGFHLVGQTKENYGETGFVRCEKNVDRDSESKIKNMEIELIRDALERFGTSTKGKEKAARYLGISRATLYRRLKEIG